MKNILNLSGYKFIKLNKLSQLCEQLRAICQNNTLLGTILLAEEGINISLAGTKDNIENFLANLHSLGFSDIDFKFTYSDFIPFEKLVVKVREEIVTFAVQDIVPQEQTGKYISATELKSWFDEKKDFYLMDVRNQCEITEGQFEHDQFIDLKIDHFRDFAAASKNLSSELKQKTLVMYCTGGIRCEKASALLIKEGFEKVYQLEGGILKYFAECGKKHYKGKCFVFDNRIAIED